MFLTKMGSPCLLSSIVSRLSCAERERGEDRKEKDDSLHGTSNSDGDGNSNGDA